MTSNDWSTTMANLAVVGCSFSDRTKVEKSYGDYLSEMVDYNYIHLARGAGSNIRSVYKAATSILEGTLGSGDVLLFQFTDPHRKIISSHKPMSEQNRINGRIEEHDTPYGKGYTSDYKAESWTWQGDKELVLAGNKSLHKLMEQVAVNNEFETDYTLIQFKLLEALCMQHNVNIVPVMTRYIGYHEYNEDHTFTPSDIVADISQRFHPDVKNKTFYEWDFIRVGGIDNPCVLDYGFSPEEKNEYDNSHLSKEGHIYLAQCLKKHLLGHKLLDTQ
jgi:hypothetical protein